MDPYTLAAGVLCAVLIVALLCIIAGWSLEDAAPAPPPEVPQLPLSGYDNAKGWSFALSYTARDDDGKPFPARSVFYTETNDLADAIEEARAAAIIIGHAKIGAFLPGQHARVP